MNHEPNRSSYRPFCHKRSIYKDAARGDDCHVGGKHEWAQWSSDPTDRRCPYRGADGARCPLDEHHAIFGDPVAYDPPSVSARVQCGKRRGDRINGRQCVRGAHDDGEHRFGKVPDAGASLEDPRPPGVQLPAPHVGPKVTPEAFAGRVRDVTAPMLARLDALESAVKELTATPQPLGDAAKLRRVARRQAKATERCAAALETIASVLDLIDSRLVELRNR